MTDSLLHIIALTMKKGIGPILTRHLIAYCGNAKSVFEKSESELASIPNIGSHVAALLRDNKVEFKKAEKEIEETQKKGIKICSYLDEDYPYRLKNIDDAPAVLYHKGNIEMNFRRTIGIVGTRAPSDLGKAMTDKIVEGLKPYGVQVISGMAYGIDTQAHRASVIHEVPTIGILGHGLDMIYPSANRELALKMNNQGGLISEFPIGTTPEREHFPMRNRIIAAMSDAVIVVESKKKGGSMITAKLAMDYHKDVFAVPGRIGDDKSAGCNHLIKTHQAALIESASDIGYVMQWDKMENLQSHQSVLFYDLEGDEKKIVETLRKHTDLTLDKLHHLCAIPLSQLSGKLLNLEFQGIIICLPGKRYKVVK